MLHSMKLSVIRCFFLRLSNAFKQSAIFKFYHRQPPFIEMLRFFLLKGVEMKKYILFLTGTIIVFLPVICLAQTPHEIAGFVLGENISDYKDRLRMETNLPIRHMEFLHEVEAKKIDGFKSGLIGYGTCKTPGRILRIKLKYADSSKKFYDALLKRFQARFGKPTEWQGDPFHIVINWKWSFTDKKNNKISLHLQHNTKDMEEKLGNSVKLSMTSAIKAERLCYQKKHPESLTPWGKQKGSKEGGSDSWNQFIPR